MKHVKHAVSIVSRSGPSDQFSTIMSTFQQRAQVEVAELERVLQQAQRTFVQQALRFGEDAKQVTPEQLFSIIHSFTMSLLV
jgi:hypothetical protein